MEVFVYSCVRYFRCYLFWYLGITVFRYHVWMCFGVEVPGDSKSGANGQLIRYIHVQVYVYIFMFLWSVVVQMYKFSVQVIHNLV